MTRNETGMLFDQDIPFLKDTPAMQDGRQCSPSHPCGQAGSLPRFPAFPRPRPRTAWQSTSRDCSGHGHTSPPIRAARPVRSDRQYRSFSGPSRALMVSASCKTGPTGGGARLSPPPCPRAATSAATSLRLRRTRVRQRPARDRFRPPGFERRPALLTKTASARDRDAARDMPPAYLTRSMPASP